MWNTYLKSILKYHAQQLTNAEGTGNAYSRRSLFLYMGHALSITQIYVNSDEFELYPKSGESLEVIKPPCRRFNSKLTQIIKKNILATVLFKFLF